MGPTTRPEPALRIDARGRSARRTVALFTATGLLVAVAAASVTCALALSGGRREAASSFTASARAAAAALAPSLRPAARGDGRAATVLRGQVEGLRRSGVVSGVDLRDSRGRVLWADPAPAGAGGRVLRAVVAVPVDGERMLLTFTTPDTGTAAGAPVQWLLFAPVVLGAVLLVQSVQIPLGWRLARRLDEAGAERRNTARAASRAAEAERHRIAAHLHDHVVQDLTGLAYELDLARLGPGRAAGDDEDLLGRTASGLREAVGDLRRLLVDLVPAGPERGGLAASLDSLRGRLARQGVDLTVRMSGREQLPAPTAAVLYRCAQEALRNVAAHSRAATVVIRIRSAGGRATMTIEDDGCGFEEGVLARRLADGHVGLRALGHLLADAGGSLTATSAPGRGTRLVARVPLACPAGGRIPA